MKELEVMAKELKACGEKLVQMAEELSKLCQPKESKKEVTLPKVRAVLAEKSRAGFTKEVKELLIRHGADKLSEIAPEKYETLLAEAEVLGNG